MDVNKVQIYLHLLRNLGQLFSLARLYPQAHPVVQSKMKETFVDIQGISGKKESIVFSVQGGIMFVNGEQIESADPLLKKLTTDFAKLKIGSLDLEPGLTFEELGSFTSLLTNPSDIIGEEAVKNFLSERNTKNIIPRFATYVLVQEDEKVVKENTVISMDNVSPEVVKAFSADLKNSIINDKALVHHAGFLSSALTDLSQEVATPDEMLKLIWTIGEYLIDEISTVKQEEINRKVLEQVKGHLLSLWKEKENKEHWTRQAEDSFAKIIAALQIKKLVLSYKRNKKATEGSVKRLRSLLKNIPPESQLYKKVKEELKLIGRPHLDEEMFS